MMHKKAIFLDRDGTIIVDRVYLNDPNGILYLPNAFEGLRRFRDMGYLLIVVTNQSGVARGLVQIENLYKIHDQMRADLAGEGIDIAGFYYAPYGPETRNPARKPGPGMLLTAAQDFGLDLKECWMIGDRMTDVEAGHAAGARSILIGPDDGSTRKPELNVKDLLEAAQRVSLII